ncbi:MAG: protein-L-isoaspartate(D-aspartate) O-methyltransferase [Deltaproteobacteria bacterium]|nr:protein-L-isoaspartate(D-aspartate) O-methyltransferase [Deltaproteobacteria bacterium]
MSIAACGSNGGGGEDLTSLRIKMVNEQIAERGVVDTSVLRAMRIVPRHEFVPADSRNSAYADYPLSIGHDQTISQPYIVAYMTEALAVKKGHKILEIGTGSGYQAAVLAQMGADVYSIEIVEPLGVKAREVLTKLGYKVHLKIGDGYEGWPAAAPFDGIIVTAAPKKIPAPLVDQLKEGGRLVIPVGSFFQDLKVFKKMGGKLKKETTLPVRFVPMTGKADAR